MAKNPFLEIGRSGTINSNGIIDNLDEVGAWSSGNEYETVRKMRNNAIIQSIEKGLFLPIKRADLNFYFSDENPYGLKFSAWKEIIPVLLKGERAKGLTFRFRVLGNKII